MRIADLLTSFCPNGPSCLLGFFANKPDWFYGIWPAAGKTAHSLFKGFFAIFAMLADFSGRMQPAMRQLWLFPATFAKTGRNLV
jgi:hypothetical protein